MKKPKFSVAASRTKKPKTTFSRFIRPPAAVLPVAPADPFLLLAHLVRFVAGTRGRRVGHSAGSRAPPADPHGGVAGVATDPQGAGRLDLDDLEGLAAARAAGGDGAAVLVVLQRLLDRAQLGVRLQQRRRDLLDTHGTSSYVRSTSTSRSAA